MPQPLKTAQEILDYADPNHPSGFWRKKKALEMLCEAIEREVIGKEPLETNSYCSVHGSDCSCGYEVRSQLRTQQRQALRRFFGQPNINKQPSSVDITGVDVNEPKTMEEAE